MDAFKRNARKAVRELSRPCASASGKIAIVVNMSKKFKREWLNSQ